MELPRVSYGRRGNKRFNYKPRYYNEEQEDLEDRIEKITSEVKGEYSAAGSRRRIQSAFKNRNSVPVDPNAQQQKLVSKVRILLIALLLGSAAYLVFYTNTISIIFEAFKNA